MDKILIIDTETTGLDPAKGKVLEIAGVLYHIPTRSILAQTSGLCYAEDNAAYEINRIDTKTLTAMPPTVEGNAKAMLIEMMLVADALVAHNAEFDKKWLETIVMFQPISKSKKWICTRNDVVWPVRKGISLTLVNIAVDLGVPIILAHRALSDCHILLQALECIEDIEHFLDKSGQGRMIYHADISYEKRQIAKEAGFQWDNVKKVWHAKLTPEQAATLSFMVYPAV